MQGTASLIGISNEVQHHRYQDDIALTIRKYPNDPFLHFYFKHNSLHRDQTELQTSERVIFNSPDKSYPMLLAQSTNC